MIIQGRNAFESFESQLDGAGLAFAETEADYGAAATQQKVRWYQTILRIVAADPTVSLNGNHNDPLTRKALRKLQEYYGLEPASYLTVESNAALTQIALEWIYRIRISNKIGKWSSTLTDRIKQFQGIMQHVNGHIDNSLIRGIFSGIYKYTINLFENRFAHLVDTTPGQSGSPIWRQQTHPSQVRKLVGVATVAGESFNQGVALAPAFLQEIVDWAPETFRLDGRRLLVRPNV